MTPPIAQKPKNIIRQGAVVPTPHANDSVRQFKVTPPAAPLPHPCPSAAPASRYSFLF
jgi:hypothetical protein